MSTANKRKRGDDEPDAAEEASLQISGRSSRGEKQRRGDGKKMTAACTACRKLKIKCDMPTEQPPCARCQRRKLSCVLHCAVRPGSADISLMRKDLHNHNEALGRICQHLGIDPPPGLASSLEATSSNQSPAKPEDEVEAEDEELCELSPPASPSALQAPINTFLESAQSETSPNGTSPRLLRRKTLEQVDLITRGLITTETAEVLVQRYLTKLDPFLYGIASRYKDLESVRAASPTLLSAMCAVSALHSTDDREAFDICNKEYRQLIHSSMFEKRDLEFVRALCIGSFWLLNASRILSSDAIRRAADVRLHRQSSRLRQVTPTASPEQVAEIRDRVRLWYLLFVGDQHLSILHNRESLTRPEQDIIERSNVFLEGPAVVHADIRIMSQVSLLHIMSQIRDAFHSDVNRPLPKSMAVQFSHFQREIDDWHASFLPRFEVDPCIGDFPVSGLYMHCQFAKLYLGHHIFRDLKDNPIPVHFLRAAITAYAAATTIFNIVLDDQAFRDNLIGVPHYFHIMISFAGRFLLEVCMSRQEQLNVNVDHDLRLMSSVLALFVRMPTLPQHPLTRVTAGLMRQLSACTTGFGLANVMTGSPFGNMDGACGSALDMLDQGSFSLANLDTTVDPLSMPAMPQELLNWGDLGNFSFEDLQYDFST